MTSQSPTLASPGLRLRSPQSTSKSNIAISRGSIDYGITNTKAHAYNDEQQEAITLVFSKKKLLGAALSFIVYTAVVVLAVGFATKSDVTSTPNTNKASSSSLSSSIMEIGGSNTTSNTAIGLSSSNQVNQAVNNNNLDTTANIVATTANNLPVSAYGGKTSKYSRESSKTSKEVGGSKSSKGTYSSFYNLLILQLFVCLITQFQFDL